MLHEILTAQSRDNVPRVDSIMNTQLSPERKAMFIELDAIESVEKMLKAVDRAGGSGLKVTAKICGCHMLKKHDWDGKEFGEEMQK